MAATTEVDEFMGYDEKRLNELFSPHGYHWSLPSPGLCLQRLLASLQQAGSIQIEELILAWNRQQSYIVLIMAQSLLAPLPGGVEGFDFGQVADLIYDIVSAKDLHHRDYQAVLAATNAAAFAVLTQGTALYERVGVIALEPFIDAGMNPHR